LPEDRELIETPSREPTGVDLSICKTGRTRRRRIRAALAIVLVALLAVAGWLIVGGKAGRRHPPTALRVVTRPLRQSETGAVVGEHKRTPGKSTWHPPHVVKVWMVRYKRRTFRIIQLPRCEHLETVITYDPSGETVAHAKKRLGGVAACTGSFHNPKSMVLADFLQRRGTIVCPARTGRHCVVLDGNGALNISGDYAAMKGNSGYSAIALGQRLVPLQRDGFSLAFINKTTDRMAVGLNRNFIFIVQGKSDIWKLAGFLRTQLPVRTAVNCDGGHVVRGKGPVHLVFRWRKR
jgi:hypothetical protein